jgi:rubrerythrin
MALLDEIKQRFKRAYGAYGGPQLHHECRRCGTTVTQEKDGCPTCGSSEIARISIKQ